VSNHQIGWDCFIGRNRLNECTLCQKPEVTYGSLVFLTIRIEYSKSDLTSAILDNGHGSLQSERRRNRSTPKWQDINLRPVLARLFI